MAQRPTVTVVIPTYRRDDLLQRCLEAVLSQDWPPEALQVIVVDDAGSTTTPEAVGEVALRHPDVQVLVLGGSHGGPAAARNTGWRAATGDVIAFVDDDAFPAGDDWIREGVRALRATNAPAVMGKVLVPLPPKPSDFQRNVANLETAEFLTCNAFVPRAALEAAGGFDEGFRVPFREDSDLQFRLEAAAGARVLHADRAVVIHPAPRGGFGESVRRQRYSMYNALLYRKHRERYRQDIERRPPLAYYAMTALSVAAVVLLVAGKRSGWVALGGWGFLLARFLARRLRGIDHSANHIADMVITSIVIPPVSVFWRLRGAARFRVLFW
jgi:glycosyltransferase involved in cell wall biosynthesis